MTEPRQSTTVPNTSKVRAPMSEASTALMLLYRAVGVSLAAPPWRVNRPAGAVERAFHVLSYE